MSHARDTAKDTTLESVSQINETDRFHLSHLTITEGTIAKTKNLTVEMHKTGYNHHTKTENKTPVLIVNDEVSIVQPGHKIKHTGIEKGLIILPETAKLVLSAWKLECRALRSSNLN